MLAKQRLSSLCKYLQIAFLSFSCCRPQKEKKSLLAGWLLPSLWLSVYVGCQSFKVFQLIIINIIITGHHMDSVCHLGMNKFPEFSQHLRATKLAPKINSFKWSPGDCVNCSLHDFFFFGAACR